MTDIELLFREYRRGDTIKYEEFISAGWSKSEYLEYLGKCEVVKSGIILLSGYGKMTNILKKDSSRIIIQLKEAVSNSLEGLLCWLQKYFTTDIEHFKFSPDFFAPRYLFSYTRNCPDIYISSDEFRENFEYALNIRLLEDYNQIIGDDISLISDEEIESEISRIKKNFNDNEFPQEPDYNSYADLQKWAGEMDAYDSINESAVDLDVLEEELRNRENRFNIARDTLYIYSGTVQCLHEHSSEIESVTANIQCYDGTDVILNINYCPICNYYFLRQSEYDYYKSKYGSLPLRMQFKGGNPNIKGFNNRNEYSILSLAGYSVSQKDGLSESERQSILVNLLYNGVTKFEIINHLSMLAETNGSNPRMYSARDKWITDLRFVRDYKIDEQRKKEINKIKFGKPKS